MRVMQGPKAKFHTASRSESTLYSSGGNLPAFSEILSRFPDCADAGQHPFLNQLEDTFQIGNSID
jgi:hypothetical protein